MLSGFRSKDLETSCNAAALQGVGIQAIVTEYLIMYSDLIFCDKMPNFTEGLQPGKSVVEGMRGSL